MTLPNGHVKEDVLSVLEYHPVETPDLQAGINWDDDRLALVLGDNWRGMMGYFRAEWHEFVAGVWDSRDPAEVRRAIRAFLRQFRVQGVKVNQRQITALEAMMRDAIHVPDRTLNALQKEQRLYIPLRNGLFNLETWKLEPHRQDLYFTHRLDFDFDEDADCPTFRHYLSTSFVKPDGSPDPELRDFISEALAYSMTARTDLKASFWLLGKGDAGKSTLLAFIRELMGAFHVTIDLNQMGANKFMLSALIGKRVATFTEAEAGTMLADGIYKAISGGGDAIWTDVKNKEAVSFVPEAKLWWAMNNPPRTRDRSDAIFNRLKIIPLNRSIPKSERDPRLVQKLVAERSGIFTQLMFDYRRLVRRGDFLIPAQSTNSLETYRLQNDTEKTFLLECTKQDTNGRIQAQTLYNTYKDWCADNGFRPKQRNEVSQDWERLGLRVTKSDGKHFWIGAVLIQDEREMF